MTKAQLLTLIETTIKSNGVQQITGDSLNYVLENLLALIPSLQDINSGSQSLGTITTASTIPAEGNVWGFAAPGTYPNAGNLTVSPNTLGILTRVGGTWSKVEVAMPTITASQTFNPSDNVNPATMKAIADRYDTALEGFVEGFVEDKLKVYNNDNVSKGGYVNNLGVTVGLLGCDFIKDIDAKNIYKIILNSITTWNSSETGDLKTVLGKKADGSYVTIFHQQDVVLVNKEVLIPEGITTLYLNFKSLSTNKITLYRNTVKNYITSIITGGSGSSSDAVNSVIYAEKFGVSASATATENTSILNQLFLNTKESGIKIILPSGDIKINGTLNVYSGNNIEGTGWGGTFRGGTRFIPTSNFIMMNIVSSWSSEADIQDGQISGISFDGKSIAAKGFKVNAGTAYFRFSRCNFTNFTQICGEFEGSLIFDLDRCRFRETPRGILINQSVAYAANLITFNLCQFTIMSQLACDINGGAQVTFNQCDWEQCGTVGNTATGAMNIRNMSRFGEGIDVTLNGCWSEYVRGGFWMNIEGTAEGVTTIRDSMLWRLSGDAVHGVKNNGSKLLITGSTKINDFTTDILTTNNGQTKVDGFVRVNTHVENTGGTYKTADYS